MATFYDLFKIRCDYIRQFIKIIEPTSHNVVFLEDADFVLDLISKVEYDNVPYIRHRGIDQIEDLMFYDFAKHRDKRLSYTDFVKQCMPVYSKADLLKRYTSGLYDKFTAKDLLEFRVDHLMNVVKYLAELYDFVYLAEYKRY